MNVRIETSDWIEYLKNLEDVLNSVPAKSTKHVRVAPDLLGRPKKHSLVRKYKVVQNRMELVGLLKDSLELDDERSWKETRQRLYHLLWTWRKPQIRYERLLPWQRVNHFRGVQVLTKKDALQCTLRHYQGISSRFAKTFALQTDTYVLPKEYTAFLQAFSKHKAAEGEDRNIWILKPASMSRGRGIRLVHDLDDVTYSKEVVLQKYVENPLLLDGYKFDLRIYVLVTSFQPLEAYIYEDGFARFALTKYDLHVDRDGGDASMQAKELRAKLQNLQMHLTNSSVQHARLDLESVLAKAAPFQRAPASKIGGSKMHTSELWRQLSSAGHDVDKIRTSIDECIIKSLLCADDHIKYQSCAFEVFGYDILIDSELRPWLVEVNASPSMGCLNDLDRRVKRALIRDTVALVDPLPVDVNVLRRFVSAARADAVGSRRLSMKTLFDESKIRGVSAIRDREYVARLWNKSINRLLCGATPRPYGVRPGRTGRYRRLCPGTRSFRSLVRLKHPCIKSITGMHEIGAGPKRKGRGGP
eukprot:g2190.t1